MKQKLYVVDNTGKQIEIVNIEEAIRQVKLFISYETSFQSVEVADYWKDLLVRLEKVKSEVEVDKESNAIVDHVADKLPTWVNEIRQKYSQSLSSKNTTKLFVKDKKNSQLFGAHSCVKNSINLRKLDALEVGETWERFGSPNLTRIF